jgi:beta-lactamase superfamily II metal-dependent hydrolase
MVIDEIVTNNQSSSSPTYGKFTDLARHHVMVVAQRGQTYWLSEQAKLTVISPLQPLEFTDPNDNSVVVRLEVANVSFLLAGDAEADAEQSMLQSGLNLQSTLLKVGHHGSDTSTTQPFLNSVNPQFAIISAGRNNKYGHPSPVVVDRLLQKGVIVYGTYHSGTIVAVTNGTSLTFPSNPDPLPEIPSPAIMLLVAMMITAKPAIVRKRRRSKASPIVSYNASHSRQVTLSPAMPKKNAVL